MSSPVWNVFAYIFMPSGALMCMLLLSGLPFFERLAEGVSRITIKIGRIEFGCLNMFAGIAAFFLFSEIIKLQDSASRQEDFPSVELSDKFKLQKNVDRWRHERNYWISLFVLTLWVVAARLTTLIRRHRLNKD
ncbi:hypothetical protein FOL47_005868 [Perkinsus chesapeaki]|uniref:BAP29/BAP31 transmembrane domain-containing protein n=1 Tax=Perkinsus chesapeaki TaxID=330153 RepID=A0A7J6LVD4_PERCH|nr:hypothetical protein FOL47_005868 [Perkinsus chesapeaki]